MNFENYNMISFFQYLRNCDDAFPFNCVKNDKENYEYIIHSQEARYILSESMQILFNFKVLLCKRKIC